MGKKKLHEFIESRKINWKQKIIRIFQIILNIKIKEKISDLNEHARKKRTMSLFLENVI